jgi:hypothetical protein
MCTIPERVKFKPRSKSKDLKFHRGTRWARGDKKNSCQNVLTATKVTKYLKFLRVSQKLWVERGDLLFISIKNLDAGSWYILQGSLFNDNANADHQRATSAAISARPVRSAPVDTSANNGLFFKKKILSTRTHGRVGPVGCEGRWGLPVTKGINLSNMEDMQAWLGLAVDYGKVTSWRVDKKDSEGRRGIVWFVLMAVKEIHPGQS